MSSEWPHYVYWHFAKNDILLYVGVTNDLERRNKGHKTTSPWFCKVVRIEARRFKKKSDAQRAEWKAIKEQNPLHNKYGKKTSLGVEIVILSDECEPKPKGALKVDRVKK